MKRIFRLLLIISIAVLAYIFPDLFPGLFNDNITIVIVNNKTANGSGVGFFIDEKNILTASHVVEPDGDVAVIGDMEIIDEERVRHPVRVVGIDTDSEIAVLNIVDRSVIKPSLPCSRSLGMIELRSREIFYSKKYGYSRFLFLMSPFKLIEPPFLRGELLGPDWNQETPGVVYIMHDSAIIPGYSGSPLLDRNDCYLGMNISFHIGRPKISRAVSGATIEQVLPKLIKSGRVDMPFLGIILEQTLSGVFISGAIKDSPANILSTHGIRILSKYANLETYPSRELVTINSTPINRLDEAWKVLKSLPSGSTITVSMKDSSGKIESVKIVSGERFSMVRKYIPATRFAFIPGILII